jgi:hypothetical protein
VNARDLCQSLADHIKRNAASYADEICTVLADLLERKRQDYGPAERTLGEWGVLGIAVRLGDKYARLKHMVQENHTPNFEGLEDTLMDIAGYGVLGAALLKNAQESQLPRPEGLGL